MSMTTYRSVWLVCYQTKILILFIVSWFRRTKGKTSIDLEAANFVSDLSTSFSQKSYLSATTIRDRSSDAFGKSLFRAKRRFERKFGIGKRKKNVQCGDDPSANCKSDLCLVLKRYYKIHHNLNFQIWAAEALMTSVLVHEIQKLLFLKRDF